MLRQEIWVGCCGFPVSRKKYYQNFKIVELQNTFYELPSIEWASRFRKELPSDFTLSIKAWQVLTHPPTSPTWRKMKKKPSGELSKYGLLKPTKENFEAWGKVLDLVRVIGARFVILQTPASLPYTHESVKWVEEFFSSIMSTTPKDVIVGWEPRGPWVSANALSDLKRILEKYGVVHVVDLLRRDPVTGTVLYTRLHGLGKGEVNYRYRYADEDLRLLAGKIRRLNLYRNYVLFNNIYMFTDALRFKEIALEQGFTVH